MPNTSCPTAAHWLLVLFAPVALSACLAADTRSEAASEQLSPVLSVESVLAVRPDVNNGQELYAVCAACHQSTGWGVRDGSVPGIAGQHFRYVVKQVADVRMGKRYNPRMRHFVTRTSLDTPQAVADIAAYVEGLPRSDDPTVGDGQDLDRGAEIYALACAACHLESGRGSAALGIPRIAGQHYPYVALQLEAIGLGTRHNFNDYLPMLVGPLSEADRRAVSDYVSRLPGATDK